MKISAENYAFLLDRLTELWDKQVHTRVEMNELTTLVEAINAYEAAAYPIFSTPITTPKDPE